MTEPVAGAGCAKQLVHARARHRSLPIDILQAVRCSECGAEPPPSAIGLRTLVELQRGKCKAEPDHPALGAAHDAV